MTFPTRPQDQEHPLATHNSFLNKMPATFDARQERKVSIVDNTEESTGFLSDDCDEKRTYTPQPRQITMLGGGQKANASRGIPQAAQPNLSSMAANSGMIANRSMLGLSRYEGNQRMINKSSLSCLNNRSMMVSDNSHDNSAYMGRGEMPKFGDNNNKERSTFLSSLFNQRSASFFGVRETEQAPPTE